MTPIVRTVRGDIPVNDLGITYMHEHLIGHALTGGEPDLVLDDEDAAILDLHAFKDAGGRALVEMSPRDYSRDPLALRRISEASGVHIITVTGFIKGTSAAALVTDMAINAIADEMIRDVCEGIGTTGVCAGLIKAGSSLNAITTVEEKIFRAAARAHRETGALISTHTEAGTMALEQVALLTSEGVAPERILIGHMDRNLHWDTHLAVARTGVTLGFDQFAKEKYAPDALRVAFIRQLADAGFRDQIAISGDMARRSYLPGYSGGPGFAYILERVVPMLRDAQFTEEDITALFVQTPARLLGIQPS